MNKKRMYAFIIDSLFSIAISIPLKLNGVWIIPLLFFILYYILTDYLLQGSLGKRILGMKVYTENGNSLSFRNSVRRQMGRFYTLFTLNQFNFFKETMYHDHYSKTIVKDSINN